jgi:hypothetical protein
MREITEAKEKLNLYFFDGQPERLKIADQMMSQETEMIKLRFGIEFVIDFFDFFDYYYIILKKAPAFHGNVHSVFENFYHFLNKLRYQIPV